MQEIKRCIHHKTVRSKKESERWSGQLELIWNKICNQEKFSVLLLWNKSWMWSVAFGLVQIQPGARIHTHFAQKPTAVVLFSLVQLSSFVIQVHCLIELNPHVFGSHWKEATFVGSLTVLVIVCDLKWICKMVE